MTNPTHFNSQSEELYATRGPATSDADTAHVKALNAIARLVPASPTETLNANAVDAAIKSIPAEPASFGETHNDLVGRLRKLVSYDMNGNPNLKIGAYDTLVDGFNALNKAADDTSALSVSDKAQAFFSDRIRTRQIYWDMSHSGMASVSMTMVPR